MKRIFIIFWLSVFVLAAFGKSKIDQDPFYLSFFQKTRLIMSKEEIEIYKHLPDSEAKAEFIEEFWQKRDPNPETDENEVKQEFQDRIDYANRWFNEHRGHDMGWDTQRGRILLQLGFPEERHWGEIDDIFGSEMGANRGKLRTTQRIPIEIWYYFRYQMVLTFIGDRQGFGTFKLAYAPTPLAENLKVAIRRLDLGLQKPRKNAFRFDAGFNAGNIKITIPVKRISFEEGDAGMNAEFSLQVNVYRDYEMIDSIEEKFSVNKDKEELLNIKDISYVIPYSPMQKGRYYFDIIITDEASAEKYRNYCKYKK